VDVPTRGSGEPKIGICNFQADSSFYRTKARKSPSLVSGLVWKIGRREGLVDE